MRFKLQNALNKISVFSSTIHIPRISRNFSLHSGFWFQSLGRDNYTRPITYIMPTNYLHIGEFWYPMNYYLLRVYDSMMLISFPRFLMERLDTISNRFRIILKLFHEKKRIVTSYSSSKLHHLFIFFINLTSDFSVMNYSHKLLSILH